MRRWRISDGGMLAELDHGIYARLSASGTVERLFRDRLGGDDDLEGRYRYRVDGPALVCDATRTRRGVEQATTAEIVGLQPLAVEERPTPDEVTTAVVAYGRTQRADRVRREAGDRVEGLRLHDPRLSRARDRIAGDVVRRGEPTSRALLAVLEAWSRLERADVVGWSRLLEAGSALEAACRIATFDPRPGTWRAPDEMPPSDLTPEMRRRLEMGEYDTPCRDLLDVFDAVAEARTAFEAEARRDLDADFRPYREAAAALGHVMGHLVGVAPAVADAGHARAATAERVRWEAAIEARVTALPGSPADLDAVVADILDRLRLACARDLRLSDVAKIHWIDQLGEVARRAGTLGTHTALAIEALAERTDDRQSYSTTYDGWTEWVYEHALKALQRLGAAGVAPLIRALDSPFPLTRQRAADALGVIGPAAADAADALSRLARDAQSDDGRAAARALERVRPSAS